MTGYDPARYGSAAGAAYDALYPEEGLETAATVALLAELAQARPQHSVLELAVGTGRVALGLQRSGLRVAGIDASEAMLDELRRKPGGDAVEVTVGDYATARAAGPFAVVALLFNGIFDPRGDELQLEIFRNAARHLDVGGCFVIEGFVLTDAQRSGDWMLSPRYVGDEHVELHLARFDIATNRLERTLVHLRPEGLSFLTSNDVYAAPGELDVMATATGFRRIARYAGWSGEPFTAASIRHVSVYELVRQEAAPASS